MIRLRVPALVILGVAALCAAAGATGPAGLAHPSGRTARAARAPGSEQTAPSGQAGQQAPAAPTAAPTEAERREVTFRISAVGRPLGSETVTVQTTPTEIRISSTGQLNAPLSLQLNSSETRYDRNWRPLGFSVDSRVKDQPVRITTTFAGGKATSQIIEGDKSQTTSHDVSEQSIILPNNVFGGYEAVVARLATLQPGATLRAYVLPQAEIGLTFDSVSTERTQTTSRAFQSKHYVLTAQNPGKPLKIELWADDRNHLMRIAIPTVPLDISRDDIARVSTRQLTTFRENDEDVLIPANGFNLDGTVSRPTTPPPPVKGKPAKLPAIVLVAGSGLLDRDETVAGIAVFAQLAGALADAGYVVVRYDKRGVGQSGGRVESATLGDYAEDVRAVVRYLTKRKDVDEDRIAVTGYREGAAVALIAARSEKKIRALVLMAGPGTTGAELLLEQQRHALDRLKLPDAERDAKIAMQLKIQAAAISGQGWDDLPPGTRRQADSPWFASMLQFNPVATIEKVKQPMLIVQGELDRQIPAHHADKLATLARARKKATDVQVAKFPTLNHLFVAAKTGEIDEYRSLAPATVATDVTAKIAEWLSTTLAQKT